MFSDKTCTQRCLHPFNVPSPCNVLTPLNKLCYQSLVQWRKTLYFPPLWIQYNAHSKPLKMLGCTYCWTKGLQYWPDKHLNWLKNVDCYYEHCSTMPTHPHGFSAPPTTHLSKGAHNHHHQKKPEQCPWHSMTTSRPGLRPHGQGGRGDGYPALCVQYEDQYCRIWTVRNLFMGTILVIFVILVYYLAAIEWCLYHSYNLVAVNNSC